MITRISLRMRLTAIILLPLLIMAVLAGVWQLSNARQTATDVFDRSLLSAALAVVNDVAISDGDALSERTRDLLADTSGARVFYHVYGPDGVIVAGYATPPVGIGPSSTEVAAPTFFDAIYLGQDVSGVRLRTQSQVEGLTGIFTTTVWQESDVRARFVRDLVFRSFATILGLIVSLALIVWFGVRIGLRPLLELEEAIARRTSDDLAPIQRSVPEEVVGVVRTLNRLFAQVSQSMAAQHEFISNAAHQLRNPIAGVLSLAEAVQAAPNEAETKRRSKDLLDAAQETANLSQQLLILDRARSIAPTSTWQDIALKELLSETATTFRETSKSVIISLDLALDVGVLKGDRTMLREALRNLIDNALRHGGPSLSAITMHAERREEAIEIAVSDNGVGIPDAQLPKARERFAQIAPTSASGLGLSIVEAIVAGHGGTMMTEAGKPGLTVILRFPLRSAL